MIMPYIVEIRDRGTAEAFHVDAYNASDAVFQAIVQATGERKASGSAALSDDCAVVNVYPDAAEYNRRTRGAISDTLGQLMAQPTRRHAKS